MSFPAYEEYRDTGVSWLGELPKHWQSGALCRIATRVVVGIAEAATHAYADTGITILRATNIRASRIIGEFLYVNEDYSDDRESKQLQGGDLVTVRTGNAGVTAIVPDELDGCQCFTMLITTLDSDSSAEFYCYWLNSLSAQSYFTLEGWGTAQVNISVPILKGLQVPMPPLDEQKAISSFLDVETSKIDGLVSEQRRLIELLKEKRQAVISHAVTKGLNPNAPMKPSGIQWPIDVPQSWEVVQLRRNMELQRGVDITKDEQVEGDVPVVSSGGISSYHNEAIMKGPGVILGRKGSVGSVHYVEQDYWPHDTTLYVKEFRGNLPRFVYYKMCSMELASYDTGSSNPTLNRNVLHPVKVPWPPLGEQREIVDQLDKVFDEFDTLEAEAERAIELLQERRTALISAAVTGKIDVREFANQETL